VKSPNEKEPRRAWRPSRCAQPWVREEWQNATSGMKVVLT
jgi:hypothetical protein